MAETRLYSLFIFVIVMRKILCILSAVLMTSMVSAQSLEEQFNAFRQAAEDHYASFREAANAHYAEFLRSAWEYYEQTPAIPRPEDKPTPPVIGEASVPMFIVTSSARMI